MLYNATARLAYWCSEPRRRAPRVHTATPCSFEDGVAHRWIDCNHRPFASAEHPRYPLLMQHSQR